MSVSPLAMAGVLSFADGSFFLRATILDEPLFAGTLRSFGDRTPWTGRGVFLSGTGSYFPKIFFLDEA